MFDRGKKDGSEGPVAVEITLEDGRDLRGQFTVPHGRSLSELLNNALLFVEFEPLDGQRTYIAKASLRTVKPLDLPPQPSLPNGNGNGRDAGEFDPYAILGVKPGADKDEVHRAYIHLAKAYHPDRYETSNLPAEVRQYLSAMVRRINAAHDAVQSLQRQAARQEPVFTSPGRS